VDEHDVELLSAPRLLEELPLKGAVVTGDALYCQRALCQQIVAAGGDYVVIVKGNQPRLLAGHPAIVRLSAGGDDFRFCRAAGSAR